MTIDEARKVLAGRIEAEEVPIRNQEVIRVILKPFILEGAVGNPVVIIDRKTQKLLKVMIDFSIPSDTCLGKVLDEGAGYSERPPVDPTKLKARQLTTVEAVGTKYLEKYGRPKNEIGSWPSEDEAMEHIVKRGMDKKIECTRLWQFDGQVVTATLAMPCESLFLTVEYAPERNPEI